MQAEALEPIRHIWVHEFYPFAAYRYDPFEAPLERIESPPKSTAYNEITIDDEPGLYIYQMSWITHSGDAHRIRGVVGILERADPQTPPLIRAPLASVSHELSQLIRYGTTDHHPPLPWAVVDAKGIGDLIDGANKDLTSRITDRFGFHHRVWICRQGGLIREISEMVASSELLVIDGANVFLSTDDRIRTPLLISEATSELPSFPSRSSQLETDQIPLANKEAEPEMPSGRNDSAFVIGNKAADGRLKIHHRAAKTTSEWALEAEVADDQKLTVTIAALDPDELLAKLRTGSETVCDNWPTPAPLSGLLLGEQLP